MSQKLERITARRSLQPLDPTPVTDIDAFLKNELENSILSIVEYTSQTVRFTLSFLSICLVEIFTNKFFHQLEEEYQKRIDNEIKKTARNRRLKFLNCLYGLSELDPEIPVTRKVCTFSHS